MKPLSLPVLFLFSLGFVCSSCSSYRKQADLIESIERDAGVLPPAQDQPRDYARYGIPPDKPAAEPSSPADSVTSRYPVARKTSNPDVVESPYPPHHRVNVSDFQSGQFAKDPKSGEIFVVP
ncbi:hypothetical protein [Haloferula sp.]|uniref:hypothetical protein n=1 Tax=Haloferula sp. TaxID=2497595 RepID=UPI003C781BB0